MSDTKKEETQETLKPEGEKQKKPVKDNNAGSELETAKKIKQLNTETERYNLALAENENAKARARMEGITLDNPAEKPKEETPAEYAARVMRGEF